MNMPLVFIDRDGVEYVHTSVMVPRNLRDAARENKVSISGCLKRALESELKPKTPLSN